MCLLSLRGAAQLRRLGGEMPRGAAERRGGAERQPGAGHARRAPAPQSVVEHREVQLLNTSSGVYRVYGIIRCYDPIICVYMYIKLYI